jgi:GH15 family glucan-1,4-alpha-glucosidase
MAPPPLNDYKPLGIQDYGLIGDMHTCALVGTDGSIDFCCWPTFDSPSLFARVLDTTSGGGGHWSVRPTVNDAVVKQSYVPSTNILQTKWINQEGVVLLKDFFVIRKPGHDSPTLVRRLECIRGSMEIEIEVAPAPNYAQPSGSRHIVRLEGPELVSPPTAQLDGATSAGLCQSVKWTAGGRHSSFAPSEGFDLTLDMQLSPSEDDDDEALSLQDMFQVEDNHGVLCDKVKATLMLKEGQRVSMVLYHHKFHFGTISLGASKAEVHTREFWTRWCRRCQYSGIRTEQVQRSLLCLKLLTYQPTGAIIASPTFGLPESIGGARNWDYRYSWVRDSSFTVYVFLKMGYSEEAEAYMNFIFERIAEWQAEGDASAAKGDVAGAANGFVAGAPDGHGHAREHLPLMFRIDGSHILDEVSLHHLGGYKDSTPVRIGNGASTHVQLDIYGELMDSIYLFNKHGKPITYDQWNMVRKLIAHVEQVWQDPDMSIWEVRGKK